jgi:hypothetical protein
MKPEQVRELISGYINTQWTLTPICWPNIPFAVDPNTEFIRAAIGWGNCVIGELGVSGVDIETNTLFIDIFTKKDHGTKKPLTYAGTIRDLFRRKTLYTSDNSAFISFDQVSIREIANEDIFYHVKCSIMFHNFVC